MAKDDPIIACTNVWKLYGDQPQRYLSSLTGTPTFEDIRKAVLDAATAA